MMKHSWRKGVIALAVSTALGAASTAVYATGETTGGVSGSVQAASGQGMSGAVVTVKNLDTGLSRNVTTDANGSYRIPQLPLGRYEVTVSQDGQVVGRQQVTISLGGNASAVFDVADRGGAEVIEVVGARPSAVDMTSMDSGLVIGEAQIDRLPIARDLTSVTLLAPGAIEGDTAFGNLPSFGGATVGENVYYINGFNTTDFRNGLGGSTVPFEFYKEFQVKTGGYSAEFGRSTGGVVNAVSKSGTNTFEWGMNVYHRPHIDDFTGTGPDVFYINNDSERQMFTSRENDETVRTDMNIWAGGPIIQDKLFFFALYNPRDIDTDNYNAAGTLVNSTTDDAFWGVKLDWNITDSHTLEYTAFSDKRDVDNKQYGWDPVTEEVDPSSPVLFTNKRGGETNILKYTGNLTDDFTVSVLYGTGEADQTDVSAGDACPIIFDRRSGTSLYRGCWGNTFRGSAFDERTAKRVDFDWYLTDAHTLRFGVDDEEYDAENIQEYSGGVAYRYQPGGTTVRVRHYENNGSFSTESNSYYIQDTWRVTDTVTLELGLRNETFDNLNKDGDSFINIDSQWAPRLGMTWDMFGDGKTKVFANYGRYYLPVATNTNVRLAGGEYFTEQYFELDGITNEGQPNELPILGDAVSPVTVFSDGSVKDVRQIVDQDIDPMYQDELIIGFQTEIADGWTGGVRFVRRDLKQTLEDMAVDAALNTYYCENIDTDPACDPADAPFAHGFDYYVLGNPGEDITMNVDWDGDGQLDEEFTLTADELGYPHSERYYNALNFELARQWDGKWSFDFSYTWAQSYGNNEGFVRSDNGQDDAGLTTLFDQPGLADGTYGYLPNDRRHQIKMWGAYSISDSLVAGWNFSTRSGRPISCFGNHPTDDFAYEYGNESLYCGGELAPRGSYGRTPWTTQLDLSLAYTTEVMGGDLTLRAQILNVFDAQGYTEVNETGEEDGTADPATNNPNPPGVKDATFGLPTAYQQPRRLELSAQIQF